ncbi:hypothetical protein pb186bvf_006184 [Paramecium bursaria]
MKMERNLSYSTQDQDKPKRKVQVQSKTDSEMPDFSVYPPPKGYRPEMMEQVAKVMNFSIDSSFRINTPKKNNTYGGKQFVNPKTADLQKNKISRIKRQFIATYQDQFMNEGIQEIHNHPHAINSVLFSRLSASTLASCKWNSIQTKRRMLIERPQCPEVRDYPLDDEVKKEILKQQQLAKKIKKQKTDNQVIDNLITDNGLNINKYLNRIHRAQSAYQQIYGTEQAKYNLIIEYAEAGRQETQQFDVSQADTDIKFIEQRIKKRESPKKHHYRRFYQDEEFMAKQNPIRNTNIILQQ